MQTEPIAVIGLGCRLPGDSHGPSQFFSLLRNGSDVISGLPAERKTLSASARSDFPPWGGFLRDIDGFDAEFFRISPREAAYIDPQQRLLLEVCWEALEHAALDPRRLAGSETGVFVGIMGHDYERLLAEQPGGPASPYFFTGTSPATACGRIAHFFDFRGPTFAVDTASSASLVAVHLACRALSSGECALALAAGVNLILSADTSRALAQGGLLASDGRSRGFDSAASGFVRGEGCGVAVLKRLRDAVADGDTILAVVRGSALNQDGASEGLMAPSRAAQQALIRKALAAAGLQPDDIAYVEAHGSGTPLGDTTEGQALHAVFGARPQPLVVGSVKSNIGHLEAAAGIAGFMKAVLSLHHRYLPAHLHFVKMNPELQDAALTIPTQGQEFVSRGAAPLRAGVSSFGIGGSNAHVILEEAPPPPSRAGTTAPLPVLPLSAHKPEALRELARRYAEQLKKNPADWPAICASAQTGRAHLAYRAAVAEETAESAIEALSRIATGGGGRTPPSRAPRIAFMYTGGGAQYLNMGRALYESNATFRAALDRCDRALRRLWDRDRARDRDRSLIDLLYAADAGSRELHQMAYMQPALFAISHALTELWASWGVRPDLVLGHSLGEYGAACAAGVMDLEDALMLVCKRGQLLGSTAPGEMIALRAREADVAPLVAEYRERLSLAVVNGTDSVVLAGEREALGEALRRLAGFDATPLEISCASHSPLMDPILAELEATAQRIALRPPRLGYVSSVLGRLADDELTAPAYWRRHTRETVRFLDAVRAAHAAGAELFLEMGPKPVLIDLGQQALEGKGTWLPSLQPPRDDLSVLSGSLAALYEQGVALDWTCIVDRRTHPRVELPSYPFQRQRYWIPDSDTPVPPTRAPLDAGPRTPAPHASLQPVRSAAAPIESSVIQKERAAPASQPARLDAFVEDLVRKVLHIDAARPLSATQPLRELGLDSLMGAELARQIERHLRISVPARRLVSEGSVQRLLALLSEKMGTMAAHPVDPEPELPRPASPPASTEPADPHPVDFHGAAHDIPQIHAIVTDQQNRQVCIDGRWVDDFASCNYLGLDLHPGVIAEVLPAIQKWGVHPSWTRAVASPAIYEELERELAAFLRAPSVLVFPSVTLLHAGVLPVLAGYDGVLFKDLAAHRSMHEACLLAQTQGAELQEFRHNDPIDLEARLARCAPERTKIIVIDGVYSMSGAYPPLAEFARLARKYDALIYLDDAHGLGVIGERPSPEMPYGHCGNGLVNHYGLDYVEDRLIYVAGLSKSFSSYGAFIVCHDEAMKQKFRSASTWIFSGPSPVASLASAIAGIRYNRLEGEAWRAQIFKLVSKLVDQSKAMGFTVVNENYFPIVGVVIGQTRDVITACKILWKHRSLITPALYPIVPHDRGLLRFSITAMNTEAEIDRALAGLAEVRSQLFPKRRTPRVSDELCLQDG